MMRDEFDQPQDHKLRGMAHATPGAAHVWLALGVAALTVSSAYVLVIVLARSGFAQLIGQSESFFQTALVMHVDFALIVWLLTITGMCWALDTASPAASRHHPETLLSATGMVLMLLSPWMDQGLPIVSDYILLLDQPLFLFGLGLFFSGVGLAALRYLLLTWRRPLPAHRQQALSPLALKGSALAFCSALAAFVIAFAGLPAGLAVQQRYAELFWGAGHLLQLCHLLLLIAAWDWLLPHRRQRKRRLGVVAVALLRLLILLAMSGPLLYLLFDETGPLFTGLMELGGSLALLLLLSLIGAAAIGGAADADPLGRLARYSMALFIAGSLLGFCIRQDDAMVPAHYHGMMGAVTLAFMGLVYRVSPQLGLCTASGRSVLWQARLFSVGLALVMLGLILADLPRKAMATEAAIDLPLLGGRVLMAIGGSSAFLASLLFIGLAWRAFVQAPGRVGRSTPLEMTD